MARKSGRKPNQEIEAIIAELGTARTQPDKQQETERIRQLASQGKKHSLRMPRVDILLENHAGELFLIDLKTVKPNASAFEDYKRTLLKWVATLLAQAPTAKVHSLIAMPYNPYHPNPYKRWTMRGMLDLKHELKVGGGILGFCGRARCKGLHRVL